MAEFVEVMRQARRMCNIECPQFTDMCGKCPRVHKSCVPKTMHAWKPGDDEEYERDVMAWAAKHPEPVYPSWAEAWDILFPKHGAITIKPCMFIPGYDDCKYLSCEECAQRPIPVDIAEKLGIKPITE